jgi:phosphoglycolate phosphatase
MKNKANKNVIFDWSGTLSDNFDSFYFVVKEFCKYYNKEIPTKNKVKEIFTIPYMNFWNKLFPSLTFHEQNRLYEKFIHQAPDAKIINGVKDAITLIRRRGYDVYIVSSDPRSKIMHEIDIAGLNKVICEVRCNIHDKSNELMRLVTKCNMNTELSYYVGDSAGDIESGKKANLKTIGVTWGFNTKKKIEAEAPDYIIDNVNEILDILS